MGHEYIGIFDRPLTMQKHRELAHQLCSLTDIDIIECTPDYIRIDFDEQFLTAQGYESRISNVSATHDTYFAEDVIIWVKQEEIHLLFHNAPFPVQHVVLT